jgi:hypothetical protein
LAEKPKKGQQLRSLPKKPDSLFQVTMDLSKNDDLISQRGVEFVHWAALPSPIGLKDRGDYRRSDEFDTTSSNGMIYKKVGCFLATIVSNSKSKRSAEGGVVDYSTARLLVPRKYIDGEEIHLAPGDRVFVKDIEVLVSNYQRMEFIPGALDRAQFPIKKIDFLIDSRDIEYKPGVHFTIKNGHVSWIDGKDNPGIDPETGRGRIYSIRYKYNAHWYITEIPNEVRVTQGTNENGERVPERMPYSAIIQREYVYYNQNNDLDEDHSDKKEHRNAEAPKEGIPIPGQYKIKVDMNDID